MSVTNTSEKLVIFSLFLYPIFSHLDELLCIFFFPRIRSVCFAVGENLLTILYKNKE